MPAGTETQAPGDLHPSPDGVKVLFAMTGDDGSSSIVVADAARKSIKAVKMIKDATPLGWSLDGSSVFYIFGNAFQNEATALYRMRPDGSHRVIVVSGAGA
jgi:Tol biopolymer transport system component